jgi:hypothetical protein
MAKTPIFLPLPSAEATDQPRLPVALSRVDGTGELRLADERGSAGMTGYRGYMGGTATNKDYNHEYRPLLARGSYQRHGLFHQAWLESPAYQRAWSTIVEGLTTGHWYVEAATDDEAAIQQAREVERVLFGLDGGWERHVEEALYFLVTGHAAFIRVTDGMGQLRKLAFRFSHTISGWVTDEAERDLIAVRFSQPSGGDYVVLASDLVLYQIRALGNDWEGISPMRTAYKFIQAHQLFCQLEALAAEKYGAPWLWTEAPAGVPTSDADEGVLTEILDAAVASDNPIIEMPNGYKLNITSPAGQMPDFEPAKRYCDEQIATILKAEGSLVGLNGTGSYAMAEVKDDQQIRSLWYYAQLICRVINGEGARPYTGVIRQIVDVLGGAIAGSYPRLCWRVSASEQEASVEAVLGAKASGALDWTQGDEAWLRGKLKMPARVAPDAAPDEATPDPAPTIATISPDAAQPAAELTALDGASVADSALNGAQVASMVGVVVEVEAGRLSKRSGIEILKRAFLMSEEDAATLLNVAPATAPAAGAEAAAPPLPEVTP